MIKRFIIYILSAVFATTATAQQSYIDSLIRVTAVEENDTTRLINLGKIANTYTEINPDSAYHYSSLMQVMAHKMNFGLEEAYALREMGYALINSGNYPRSLQTLLAAIKLAEDPRIEKNVIPERFPALDEYTERSTPPHLQRLAILSRILHYAGILYVNAQDYEKSIAYYHDAIPLAEEANNLKILSIIYATLGRAYLTIDKKDSALISLRKSYEYALASGYSRYIGSIFLNLGRVYMALGREDSAKYYYKNSLEASQEQFYFRGVVASNLELAAIFKKAANPDSSLYYLQSGLSVANTMNAPDLLLRCYRALADFYKTAGNSDSTVKYQSLVIEINDGLFNANQAKQFQNIDFDEQQRQLQIEEAKREYRDKVNIYLLIAGLAVFLVIVIILWRGSRQKKMANARLSKQKEELETALKNLKSTQDQLIRAEKMASLGELTAGIAHEIENPLNFVNNFSEVNAELIDELEQEVEKGNLDAARILVKDIRENEDKIMTHGRRADAIVRSMLQHSRVSTGKKEPTDINALTDEYLRLAYHGLRVKDKSFSASFETDFDESLGKVNVVSQDIGRVILNLINNAFYAVMEKKKQATRAFDPLVRVSTRRLEDKVEVKVEDNGNGIPDLIKEKIFQPFFTTKPAGQGTGLGLSLSYDIVTKGHGGELNVKTAVGEGSVFTVMLPV